MNFDTVCLLQSGFFLIDPLILLLKKQVATSLIGIFLSLSKTTKNFTQLLFSEVDRRLLRVAKRD